MIPKLAQPFGPAQSPGSPDLSLKKLAFCLLITLSVCMLHGQIKAEEMRKQSWDTSRLVGSPTPPPPYQLVKAFPLEFDGPISLHRFPGSSTYWVLGQNGKVEGFDSSALPAVNDDGAHQNVDHSQNTFVAADFNANPPPHSGLGTIEQRRIELFSLDFHPKFDSNRFVYICYISLGGGIKTETHIARFQVSDDVQPTLIMESEHPILTCEGGGHNGCTVAFGNDGFLYVCLGDLESPNPPDPRNTGQDISDLYSSILRIDVDRTEGDNNYGIPPDNPFLSLADARPEVYAYGLRNPFRMAFDEATGDLWVGDVGWEAWEMVYRVRPGGNYGWSVTEGPGIVKEQEPGPTPILPADVALPHQEAASVTGGMVYRGDKYPDLQGTYIFGDWMTRKFWAARFDDERVIDYREIAATRVKPICFETDENGELLVLDYIQGRTPAAIYRFVPSPASKYDPADFPRLLSQTGLFDDTANWSIASGVAEYSINASMWRDGATSRFLVGIPGTHQATFHQQAQKTVDWFVTHVQLPVQSVLAKTYFVTTDTTGNSRPVETQISLKDDQGDWQYYTYRWTKDATDAELVAAEGEVRQIQFVTEGGKQESIAWQFGSRTSCRICHTPARGEALGFIEPQLRTSLDFQSGKASTGGPTDSWHALLADGTITTAAATIADEKFRGLVAPDNDLAPVHLRARSYLHANCAHCHLFGGNASTMVDLRYDKLLHETYLVDEEPMRGALGMDAGRLVVPGEPNQSILYYRIAKGGQGRMPHVGIHFNDPLAIKLIRQWISQLPKSAEVRDALETFTQPRYHTSQQYDRETAVQKLLSSREGAMELVGAIADRRIPRHVIRNLVNDANATNDPTIMELFEPFADSDQRAKRLGENILPSTILNLEGNAVAGEALFSRGVGTCNGCHRANGAGKQIGPDLAVAAQRLKTAPQILDHILKPSKEIDPKYKTISILTTTDNLITGTMLDDSADSIVIGNANGERITVAKDDIEAQRSLPQSMMPENLLSTLTAQQAADLLAFLASLK